MCRTAKHIILLLSIFSLITPSFSQDSEIGGDDVDALFEDAEDTDEAVITEENTAGTNYNVQIGTLKFPLEVSGNLNAELGGAYIREDDVDDATFYFDFKNYIYFITRPDKYLALRGTLKTSMPKDGNDTQAEQDNHLLYIYEMYFDYLMFDRVFITAGKKKSVWGNVRLFNDYYDSTENISSTDTKTTSDTLQENIDDAHFTNVLYDSRNYISGIIKVPVGNHTFTALAMYDDESTVSSTKTVNMSLAASVEFILFNTSINFFGRRFRLKEPEPEPKDYTKQLPIVGLELKRTIFGFDVYGQSMGRVMDGSKANEIFSSKFSDLSTFDRIISTAGTYRMWTNNIPYIGFNVEFQNIYRPMPDENEKYFTNRLAFEIGMAKLGPDKNIKPALQWNHNLTDKSGFVKTGVIFSRVLPHCDWKVGGKYEYGKSNSANPDHKFTKLTLGTYITINMDY